MGNPLINSLVGLIRGLPRFRLTFPGFRTGDESSPIAGSAFFDAAHPLVSTRLLPPVSPERPWAAQAEAVLLSDGASPGRTPDRLNAAVAPEP
jgi:hypothetical protein